MGLGRTDERMAGPDGSVLLQQAVSTFGSHLGLWPVQTSRPSSGHLLSTSRSHQEDDDDITRPNWSRVRLCLNPGWRSTWLYTNLEEASSLWGSHVYKVSSRNWSRPCLAGWASWKLALIKSKCQNYPAGCAVLQNPSLNHEVQSLKVKTNQRPDLSGYSKSSAGQQLLQPAALLEMKIFSQNIFLTWRKQSSMLRYSPYMKLKYSHNTLFSYACEPTTPRLLEANRANGYTAPEIHEQGGN